MTVWVVLREAGLTWCDTGSAQRVRKDSTVRVIDPDAEAQKIIECAYRDGERMGLAVWGEDEAGPYQTKPHAGASWQPMGQAAQQPHEWVRNGTAKLMTLFHPASAKVRVKGVPATPNVVLHAWLKSEVLKILDRLPADSGWSADRQNWWFWQRGLTLPMGLPDTPPRLKVLLALVQS